MNWCGISFIKESEKKTGVMCITLPLSNNIWHSKQKPFFFSQCPFDNLYTNSKEELCIISLVTEPLKPLKPLKAPLLWSQLKLNTPSCTWSLDQKTLDNCLVSRRQGPTDYLTCQQIFLLNSSVNKEIKEGQIRWGERDLNQCSWTEHPQNCPEVRKPACWSYCVTVSNSLL